LLPSLGLKFNPHSIITKITKILSRVWSVIIEMFGMVIGFIEHLQNVTTNNSGRLLSLLCLHQSLPGDGSQQCPLFP
jgi:hypothetical protein